MLALRLPHFADMRDELAPLEFRTDLPFRPQRSFLVYGVPSEDVRGEHAHRRCEQPLVAAHGRLSVLLDDQDGREPSSCSTTRPSAFTCPR